jgi:hypothetical protein
MTDKETFNARRLVLGFDAGCMTCSGIAERIKERVGDKIEVRGLREPQVMEWRKQALGEDAPIAPTLFEVKGFEVRAWTGVQMGLALSRALGPVATWRVMQALGEVGVVPKVEQSAIVERLPGKAADAVVGMSRGQFIKGVGGAAVAMSVLGGVGLPSRPASALEPWQLPNFTSKKVIRGPELASYANKVADHASCGWAAGGYKSVLQNYTFVVTSDTDGVASNGQSVSARATEYFTADGNELYVCVYNLQGEKILTYFQWARKYRNVKFQANRWGFGPEMERIWLERANINGLDFADPLAPSLQAECPTTCNNYLSNVLHTTCGSDNISCIIEIGANCALSAEPCINARKNPRNVLAVGTCIAAALACAAGLVNNQCCRQTCTICIPCAAAYPTPF